MTDILKGIKPVPFMGKTRFKLSFNTVGNCTSMSNFADKFDGEWVGLVDAHDGKNCPLYTEEALRQAVAAERARCADIVRTNPSCKLDSYFCCSAMDQGVQVCGCNAVSIREELAGHIESGAD